MRRVENKIANSIELTHGSLFSGIGGFELGAERAGIPTLWNCEVEEHKRKILRRHFPQQCNTIYELVMGFSEGWTSEE